MLIQELCVFRHSKTREMISLLKDYNLIDVHVSFVENKKIMEE